MTNPNTAAAEFAKPVPVTTMIGITLGVFVLIVGGMNYFLYQWVPDATEKSRDTTLQGASLIAVTICIALWATWIHALYNYNRYGKK